MYETVKINAQSHFLKDQGNVIKLLILSDNRLKPKYIQFLIT